MANQWESMGSANHKLKPEDKNDEIMYTGHQDITHIPDGTISNETNPEEIQKSIEEGLN